MVGDLHGPINLLARAPASVTVAWIWEIKTLAEILDKFPISMTANEKRRGGGEADDLVQISAQKTIS